MAEIKIVNKGDIASISSGLLAAATGNTDTNGIDILTILLDKIISPVIYVSKDHRYRYVNKAYADWFELSPSQISGTLVEDFLGNEAFARIKPYMEAALAGQEVSYEEEIPFRHGPCFIEGFYKPDFDESGKVKGYVALLKDITRKKKAEIELQIRHEELLNSRAHFEKLLTALPVAVYTCDNEGRITFFNDGAVKLWGYAPDTNDESLLFCPGHKVWSKDGTFMLPSQSPVALALKEGKKIVGEEIIVERPDGSRKNILPIAEPLFDTTGIMIGAVGMLMDITDGKIGEEHRAKLAAIVQYSEQAIISKTTLGIITSWNPAAEKLYGFTEEEMIGQPMSRLIPEEYINEEPEILERIRRGERVYPYETKRITKSGHLIDVSLSVSPIKDISGNVIGASNIGHDISKQKEDQRLIHENEERLRMASESTHLGTWEYHPLTKKMIWSEECKRIYGLPSDYEPEETSISRLNHPDDRDMIQERVQKAMDPANDGNFKLEYRIHRHNDNELRWLKVQGKAYFDHEREPRRFIGTMLDITKEKLHQEELMESVELFRTMADNVPAMIWMSGTDKFNDYFNKTWLEFTGNTLEKEAREGWLKNVHADDVQKCIDTYDNSLKEQKGFYCEYRLRRYDGQYRWIADNATPRYSPDGEFLGFISACIDIDDQKRFREKIQDSELLFKTISNTSPTALWMTDQFKNYIFVNDTWLKWTNSTFTDQLNKGWLSAVVPEEKNKLQALFFQTFDQRKNFSAEFRITGDDDNLRWCLAEWKPYSDITGSFAGYTGSVTDITEIKKLEQRKDDFIKMASHELKTPITSINGYVQLLLNIYKEAEAQKLQMSGAIVKSSLETIAKQVTKLTRLVSELLDLSKIETGKLELHCDEFNLEELVEETVRDIRYTTSKHALIVESRFEGKIYGDKDRLSQVLTNVLNNAIKYSPASDRVEIFIEGNEDSAIISIKDYGIGIDKKDHRKIFERFYRVEGKTEQTYPGFGIGLFITGEIVSRHKGTISVQSEKGKGSVFIIQLPIDFRK